MFSFLAVYMDFNAPYDVGQYWKCVCVTVKNLTIQQCVYFLSYKKVYEGKEAS